MKIVIPLNPLPKKNSQVIYKRRDGTPFIASNEKHKAYEDAAILFCPKLNLKGPLNIKMVFYRDSKRRVDLVNLEEMCLDVLVKAQTIEDDNFGVVASMDGSRVEIDRINPRTEIEID